MTSTLKRLFLAAGLATLTVLVGCAHPITITPDVTKIAGSGAQRSPKTVAYYVAADDMKREVTTAGGGGDKVSYFPYRDLDSAVYKSLNEVYANVTKLDTATPPAGAAAPAFVFKPVFTTTSSSSSALTWPPTDFTVDLVCKVTDATGAPVTEIAVTGTGKASFSEFKSDFALSSRRASEDAMKKFIAALEASPQLR